MKDIGRFNSIYWEAVKAGKEAAEKCMPNPMVVQEHENMLDDNSPVKKSYFVADGVCGFAWIKISPANCAFANWVRKNGFGSTDPYAGGLTIWVSDYGQSMQRKEAYAGAFVDVLQKNKIMACAMSRMD